MTGHGTRELIRGRSQSSLIFYGMLVRKLSILIALLLLASQALLVSKAASAQNVFRVRIDTMTVKAGDTATLNVYYTFNSTKTHNLSGFVARFLYDTNLIKITGYITNGTASDGMATYDSHLGLSALGTSEMNLSNPVLFKMRVAASKTLADTGWLRWDPDWPMFDPSAGVDTVIQTSGWLKTIAIAGHTTLTAPRRTVNGVITGPFADSVRFDLPVMISDISTANVSSARLQFTYDPNRLAFVMATTTSKSASIVSATTSTDTASIVFQGLNSSTIRGGDTLVNLQFYALVGADTVCTTLSDVTWQPLNADAKLGATDVRFDSICIYGRYQPASVGATSQQEPIRFYPNPARDYVISTATAAISLDIYDALGRLIARCERSNNAWLVPSSLSSGAYRAVARLRTGEVGTSALVIER